MAALLFVAWKEQRQRDRNHRGALRDARDSAAVDLLRPPSHDLTYLTRSQDDPLAYSDVGGSLNRNWDAFLIQTLVLGILSISNSSSSPSPQNILADPKIDGSGG
jgi:hypothetical protein